MAPPNKLAKTAEGHTHNALTPIDKVVIIFDRSFSDKDNPDPENFELSWGGGGKPLRQSRANTEPVDEVEVNTWDKQLLAKGHVAIAFEGLKPRSYFKLTRSNGQKEPQVIFDTRVPKPLQPENGTIAPEQLTGHAGHHLAPEDRRQFHDLWVLHDDFRQADDADLQSTPPDFYESLSMNPSRIR